MNLPLRIKRARGWSPRPKAKKPRRTSAIKCRHHVNWVLENFQCILAGKVCKSTGLMNKCFGPLDPDHYPTRGAGGGDNNVSPICRGGHSLVDSPNWSRPRVEEEYGVSFGATGDSLWEVSPYGKQYRLLEKRRLNASLPSPTPTNPPEST